MRGELLAEQMLGDSISAAASEGQFPSLVIRFTGAAALVACVLTTGAALLQLKHYMKPLLQRYVVRILVLVPIFAAASWLSLVSRTTAEVVAPIRDIYEAFTIYTFFQLLLNYIGGERQLIGRMYGRAPVPHLWPCNYLFESVDISDPHTFLAIKRGILQYVWVKPILALATIIMRTTGVYKEGYISLSSGYLWSGIIYNVSITGCLYALALFWVCMVDELKPYRPVPKFLCVKGILFASYWQGMLLSILSLIGAFPDNVSGYRSDTLAAAIQDALLCLEMPFFALIHWYAFSWHDYDSRSPIAGRMPIKYAIRDSFGCKDLIDDTLQSLSRDAYGYRNFDSPDSGLAHPSSKLLIKQMKSGMRYSQKDERKRWLPDRSGGPRAPLLQGSWAESSNEPNYGYGTGTAVVPEFTLDPDDETLYGKAFELEFGDHNSPVVPAHNHPTYKRPPRPRVDLEEANPSIQVVTPRNPRRNGKQTRYPPGSNARNSSPLARLNPGDKKPRTRSPLPNPRPRGTPPSVLEPESLTSSSSKPSQQPVVSVEPTPPVPISPVYLDVGDELRHNEEFAIPDLDPLDQHNPWD